MKANEMKNILMGILDLSGKSEVIKWYRIDKNK